MVDGELGDQHQQHHRTEVDDEVVEAEAGGGADDDVRRVADQGRRAADVGGEDLDEEERVGRELELLGDHQGDRRDEQHGGDVVEQRRDHRGDHGEQGHDRRRMAPRQLGRQDRQVLEHAAAPRQRDQQHHADEQRQRVEILAGDGLALVDDAEADHQRAAEQRHDRAVDPLDHDRGVGRDQQQGGNQQRIEAKQGGRRLAHRGRLDNAASASQWVISPTSRRSASTTASG